MRKKPRPPADDPGKTVLLPERFEYSGKVLGSVIRQLATPSREVQGSVSAFKHRRLVGSLFTPTPESGLREPLVILERKTSAKQLPHPVVLAERALSAGKNHVAWLHPPSRPLPSNPSECVALCQKVVSSWSGGILFKPEVRSGETLVSRGLRPPQIGALHAVLSHWTITHDPATVVMPTGTGKTETMLALLVATKMERLFVIVPSDSLREQIARKFQGLGVLFDAGIIGEEVQRPFVGILKKRPKTVAEVDNIFRRCNVVITTAQIAGQCNDGVTKRFAELCSHLFVDEAHHVPAKTWRRVRDFFSQKPAVQFTATPYRGDGKLVDGKVIYSYPLRKAQADGYFRKIRFTPVEEYNDEVADDAIASRALAQLKEDIAAGHDHVVMARCRSIDRAEAVYKIYAREGRAFKPVLVHSKTHKDQKQIAIKSLRDRESRVLVCVDMFGEGFDLPQLKIAALHDIHKSLAITLQFTGRFTRSESTVGEATVIANTANPDVDDALQMLYSEDPDWNAILRELTEQASGEHSTRSDFLEGFATLPDHVPLQNIYPKMSTVVFETQCKHWRPEKADEYLTHLFDKPALHVKQNVLVAVTREVTPVEWGEIRGITNIIYDLYLLHWDKAAGLLFIHSSDKDTAHEDLAKAVCGDDAALIRGERIYHSFLGINRLVISNLGLSHTINRSIRFSMHVGADVGQGWVESKSENKYKTNVFGRGFEDGERVSVGCSIRGRVWSARAAEDISEWLSWCREVGRKLQDKSTKLEEILNGVIRPTPVTERPAKVPISVEWSEDILFRDEESISFELAGIQAPLYDVDLQVLDYSATGPLRFRVASSRWPNPAEVELKFSKNRVDYTAITVGDPQVMMGRRNRPLSQFLQDYPLVVRFHDGSYLDYNEIYEIPPHTRAAFDKTRILGWNWAGTDLRKESQTQRKLADSIQRKVIETVLAQKGKDAFDIVFDDDASGEAADIVTLREESNRVLFQLYHCKYSHGAAAGKRVNDLYEVCGQAQRCVYWKGQPGALLDHLEYREGTRQRKGGVTRFERGDLRRINQIRKRLRVLETAFEVFIVQPGLSRDKAEQDQLELLAVTELHLKETWGATLTVIGS